MKEMACVPSLPTFPSPLRRRWWKEEKGDKGKGWDVSRRYREDTYTHHLFLHASLLRARDAMGRSEGEMGCGQVLLSLPRYLAVRTCLSIQYTSRLIQVLSWRVLSLYLAPLADE